MFCLFGVCVDVFAYYYFCRRMYVGYMCGCTYIQFIICVDVCMYITLCGFICIRVRFCVDGCTYIICVPVRTYIICRDLCLYIICVDVHMYIH